MNTIKIKRKSIIMNLCFVESCRSDFSFINKTFYSDFFSGDNTFLINALIIYSLKRRVGTMTRIVIAKLLPEAASLKRIQKFSSARCNNIKHRIKHSMCGQNLSVPLGFSRYIEPQHVSTVITLEFLRYIHGTVMAQYWSRAICLYCLFHCNF